MSSFQWLCTIVSFIIFLVLLLGVTSLTLEEATAQISGEVQQIGKHSRQLEVQLASLLEDVQHLVDEKEQQHDQSNGEVGCQIPSVLPNGKVGEADDWFGNEMVYFQCNIGFVMVGSSALICTNGHWNHTFPKCAAKDCKAHLSSGKTKDGVYGIIPDGQTPVLAYCDMTTDGGGWTVFQRRVDDSVDFYLTYAMYQHGFGDLRTNFWLGLDALHSLTQTKTELYVSMVANETHRAYARYNSFSVGDAASGYLLSVSGYSGTSGDSFSGHNGLKFSTYDKDQDVYDGNCAVEFKGAWWYGGCHATNLNGLYLNGPHPTTFATGINWSAFTGYYYSLHKVDMKLRRTN